MTISFNTTVGVKVFLLRWQLLYLFFLTWRGEGHFHCPQTKEAGGLWCSFHLLQVAKSLITERLWENLKGKGKSDTPIFHRELLPCISLRCMQYRKVIKGPLQTPRSMNSLILSHPDSFVGYSSSFFVYTVSSCLPHILPLLFLYLNLLHTYILTFPPVSVNKFLFVNTIDNNNLLF